MPKDITIKINGKPFTYQSEEGELTLATEQTYSESDGFEVLHNANRILNDNGITTCLSFGTLLGAVRDKSFIKGDTDIDVYTRDEKKLVSCLPIFYAKDFKVVRLRKGMLYTFRYKDYPTTIDVYILRPVYLSPWSFRCYKLEGMAVPKKFFLHTQDIEFLGDTYKCPSNPEALLEWWYGRDWRIPQSKKGRYEVASRYFVRRVGWKLNFEWNRLKKCFNGGKAQSK